MKSKDEYDRMGTVEWLSFKSDRFVINLRKLLPLFYAQNHSNVIHVFYRVPYATSLKIVPELIYLL